MTEPPDPAATPASEASASETAEQRRRRLAAVFGDVLPDTTSDERDPEGAVVRGVGHGHLAPRPGPSPPRLS